VPDKAEDNPLRAEHFRRIDETSDRRFYEELRLVTHIDDAAIAALSGFYRELLPPGGHLLDLMSSWVSHLPEDVEYGTVAGLGMNAGELQANPQLTEWVVHDLNADPALPYDGGRFDAALIAVSVQYLVRPVEVFADVARVLKPGAPLVVSYSNRCFPTKAVAAWQMLDDDGHAELIGLYFRLSGAFDTPEALQLRPGHGSDPLYAVTARALEPAGRTPPKPIMPA
jgi:SAM-dependent methyltransferase